MTLIQLLAETSDLEPREFQIASLMAQGRTNQEIADELSLNIKTVKNRVSVIWPKLGIFDGMQARDLRNKARAEVRP